MMNVTQMLGRGEVRKSDYSVRKKSLQEKSSKRCQMEIVLYVIDVNIVFRGTLPILILIVKGQYCYPSSLLGLRKK